MRQDKGIIIPTKVANYEQKSRNIYNGIKAESVRVKNFISQKQLPDTLHLTANVMFSKSLKSRNFFTKNPNH